MTVLFFCVSARRHDFLLSFFAASLAKPTLTVSQIIVTEQRDKAVFSCKTNAVNVTIHWVSNNSSLLLNERMKLSADHKTLTILLVQREDSGSYLCEVQNGFEVQESGTVKLEVNCESSRFLYLLRTPASLELCCLRL